MFGESGSGDHKKETIEQSYQRKLEAVLLLYQNQIPKNLREQVERFLEVKSFPSADFFYSGIKYFNQEFFKLGASFADLDLDPGYVAFNQRYPQGVDFLKYLEQHKKFYPHKAVRASGGKETKRLTKDSFNLPEARKLGLNLEYLPSISKADELIRRIFASNHDLDITTSSGQATFISEWMNNVVDAGGEPLPTPGMPWPKEYAAYFLVPYPSEQGKDGNFEYLKALALGRIARDDSQSLSAFGKSQKILVDDYKETPDRRAMPSMRIRPPESQLIKALGITRPIFDITPEEIDRALYQTVAGITSYAKRHVDVLEKLGLDPEFWVIRSIAYDEYNRMAHEKNWGLQEVWTMMHDKLKRPSTPSEILAAGHRNFGGASAIRPIVRKNSGFALRLVVAPVIIP